MALITRLSQESYSYKKIVWNTEIEMLPVSAIRILITITSIDVWGIMKSIATINVTVSSGFREPRRFHHLLCQSKF